MIGFDRGNELLEEVIFTRPVTPLMLKPDWGGELADEALCGMTASIVGEERGFLRVNMRYRYEGYVDPGAVLRVGSAKPWEEAASLVVISPTADVMTKPSFQSSIIMTLPRGARCASAGQGPADSRDDSEPPEWRSVSLAGWERGYIRSHSLRPLRNWEGPEEVLRARVTADAKLYLGTQYRWGGKTPMGIDCSGLASMAYLLNGLYIFRDARIEPDFPVKPIPPESAREGDLMFWDGHVGIYLGGDGYIHSTGASSGVVLGSLNPGAPNYRPDLAKVKQWGGVF